MRERRGNYCACSLVKNSRGIRTTCTSRCVDYIGLYRVRILNPLPMLYSRWVNTNHSRIRSYADGVTIILRRCAELLLSSVRVAR